MAKSQDLVDAVVEANMFDFWRRSAGSPSSAPKPPVVDAPGSAASGETEFFTRNAFQAWNRALEIGRHNPKLWVVIKGSVYEPLYRERFLGGRSV